MNLNNMDLASPLPASPLSTCFDATVRFYRISAKQLSQLSGVSENHISEFRRGKRDISTTVLSKLVSGMDQLAPGSRQQFFQSICEHNHTSSSFAHSLVDFIHQADEDELLDAMSAIALRFRFLRNQLLSSEMP